jgi:hypothetical protein
MHRSPSREHHREAMPASPATGVTSLADLPTRVTGSLIAFFFKLALPSLSPETFNVDALGRAHWIEGRSTQTASTDPSGYSQLCWLRLGSGLHPLPRDGYDVCAPLSRNNVRPSDAAFLPFVLLSSGKTGMCALFRGQNLLSITVTKEHGQTRVALCCAGGGGGATASSAVSSAGA